MNRLSKILFIVSAIFLSYGYLCRILNIYFFWDSKEIGWIILGVGLMTLVIYKANKKLEKGRKVIIHMIAFVILIFVVGLAIVFNIVIRTAADSYNVATSHIRNDELLKGELGEIKGFSLMTTGSIQKETNSNGEFGYATFELTVMGEKKFRDLTIQLSKVGSSPDWKVDLIE